MHASEHDTRPPIVKHVETIADPAQCCHPNPALLQLWSQPRDVDVNRLRFANEPRAPGAGQDAISAQNHTSVFNEDSEQVVLTRSHLQLAAFNLSAPSTRVEPQATNLDYCITSPCNAFSDKGSYLSTNQCRRARSRQPGICSQREAGRSHVLVRADNQKRCRRRPSDSGRCVSKVSPIKHDCIR